MSITAGNATSVEMSKDEEGGMMDEEKLAKIRKIFNEVDGLANKINKNMKLRKGEKVATRGSFLPGGARKTGARRRKVF